MKKIIKPKLFTKPKFRCRFQKLKFRFKARINALIVMKDKNQTSGVPVDDGKICGLNRRK